MVLHWILNDSKSPQVSRPLLYIPADPNNAIVWIVCTRPLISQSSSHFTNPLVTVPSASITIPMSGTFMFHSFSNSLGMSTYLYLFSLSFSFTLWSTGMPNSIIFFFCWLSQRLVVWPILDDSLVSQNLILLLLFIHQSFFFPISVSWSSFIGVWVTASLVKSPGSFSVFWPFSTML